MDSYLKTNFCTSKINQTLIEILDQTMMHCFYLIIWSRWLKFNLLFYLRIKHIVSNFFYKCRTRAHFLHPLLIIPFCLILTIWQHPQFLCSIVSNNALKNYLLLLCWGATMLNFLRLKSEHWDSQVEAVY